MSQKSGIFRFTSGAKKAAKGKESPQADKRRQPRQLPLYNVVLLNDNDHTYEYVVQLLGRVFAYPQEKGYQLAKQVDESSRAIVFTSHKEYAELKREQIQAFGTDHRISTCTGSMSAIIEPV